MNLVAIDIGSTWTKGVRFEIEPESENVRENVRIAARAARPTTVDNLGDGFFALLGELVSGDPLAQLASGAVQLRYSSSARFLPQTKTSQPSSPLKPARAFMRVDPVPSCFLRIERINAIAPDHKRA